MFLARASTPELCKLIASDILTGGLYVGKALHEYLCDTRYVYMIATSSSVMCRRTGAPGVGETTGQGSVLGALFTSSKPFDAKFGS